MNLKHGVNVLGDPRWGWGEDGSRDGDRRGHGGITRVLQTQFSSYYGPVFLASHM